MLALAFSLILLVILYRNRFSRLKQQEAEQLLKVSLEIEKRERERIAADLHDGVSGDLAAIRNYLLLLEKMGGNGQTPDVMAQIKTGVENALLNTRQVSYRLMPPLLDKAGLSAALRDYFERLSSQSGVAFEWTSDTDLPLGDDASYELFRVVQELTTNMIKHGRLSICTGSAKHDGRGGSICLVDNGIPFIFGEHRRGNGGAGLRNIESRLKAIGAIMKVERHDDKNQYTITFDA